MIGIQNPVKELQFFKMAEERGYVENMGEEFMICFVCIYIVNF